MAGDLMRKKFVILFLVAIFAISLFAFVACDVSGSVAYASAAPSEEGPVEGEEEANGGWKADSSACRGLITGTLTFVSEKHWIMYIGGSAADMSTNDNWCRGEYYFEGDVGRSPLHISLYGPEDYYFEEFGADEMYNQNDPAYDPSSVRLVGNDGEPVEAYGEEVVIEPDANGSYVIRVTVYGVMDRILNAGGTKEDGWFVYTLTPPQDGTQGSGGVVTAPPEGGGPDLLAIIIAVPIAAVVLIAGIVVTIILVRKNKKKKEAAAAESDPMRSYSDGSEDGGVQ